MPCNSDHMEPTSQERLSKLTAELLIYVYKGLGIENIIPQDVTNTANDFYGSPSKLDHHTAELCAFLRKMPEKTKDRIIYDGRKPLARKLASWWDKHQEADKQRENQKDQETILGLNSLKEKLKTLDSPTNISVSNVMLEEMIAVIEQEH